MFLSRSVVRHLLPMILPLLLRFDQVLQYAPQRGAGQAEHQDAVECLERTQEFPFGTHHDVAVAKRGEIDLPSRMCIPAVRTLGLTRWVSAISWSSTGSLKWPLPQGASCPPQKGQNLA